MSRSVHSLRRYVGDKFHHNNIAARKAALIPDNGKESDILPFWLNAHCECMRIECPDCGEEAKFWADYDARNKLAEQRALYQPEPRIRHTGHQIAVEWESDVGGRWWETIDEGRLSYEVWAFARVGVQLSDIDEPARAEAA